MKHTLTSLRDWLVDVLGDACEFLPDLEASQKYIYATLCLTYAVFCLWVANAQLDRPMPGQTAVGYTFFGVFLFCAMLWMSQQPRQQTATAGVSPSRPWPRAGG